MTGFKKILAPVDFSKPSEGALAYALALAKEFNAGLVIAHIVPELSALR